MVEAFGPREASHSRQNKPHEQEAYAPTTEPSTPVNLNQLLNPDQNENPSFGICSRVPRGFLQGEVLLRAAILRPRLSSDAHMPASLSVPLRLSLALVYPSIHMSHVHINDNGKKHEHPAEDNCVVE